MIKRSGYFPLTENSTDPRTIRNRSNSIGYTVKLRLIIKPSMISAESEIQRRFSSRPDTFTSMPPVLIRTESVEYSNTPLLPSINSSRLPLSSMQGAFSVDKKGGRRFDSFCFSFIVSPIHFMTAIAYILSVSKMKIKKLFYFRKIIVIIPIAVGCVICLKYTQECADGIKKGILFCIEVLVPSLYAFMALSSAVIRSGVAVSLTKPLGKLSRFLFRLPPSGSAVILLSILGGYPVGARCAAMLFEQRSISRSDAEKVANIAVCAGPGFLINYIGSALLGNRQLGIILLCAEITGVVVTGVIVGRTMRSAPLPHPHHTTENPSHNLLIASVTDASRATFHMCGMVVICTAMIAVIEKISPDERITDIASAIIEITEGCHRMCGSYPLYLIAFFIGFGGISVHLQAYAGMGDLHINKGLFFLYRIIQGIITAAAAYSYLMIFPVDQGVFNSTDTELTVAKSATLAGSAALVLSSLCFIGSIHRRREQ